MRQWWRLGVAAALLTSACDPMPPSGDPLAPVRIEAAPPRAPARAAPEQPAAEAGTPASAGAASSEAEGFDFAGEDRPDDVGARDPDEMDPVELQARLLGVDPALLRRSQPQQQPVPAQPAQPVAQPAPPSIGEWDPAQPLPDGSFGIRLLATLTDVQPPRAVIGLPDGTEQVVQPGAFLEAHRLVVMAIGRDVVQVARIVPQGYYARIDTQNVQALFPSQRREPLQ